MQWLDEESVTALVYLFSLRAYRPDIFINECTPYWQAEVMEDILPEYAFQSLVFTPLDLGIPSSRERKYTIGINKATMTQLLSLDSATFQSLTYHRLACDATIFLRASEKLVKDYLDRVAGRRGILPRQDGQTFLARAVLPTGDRLRLDAYIRAAADRPSLSGPLFVDITQNVAVRPSMNRFIPCLLRRSVIYCINTDTVVRPLLPLEQLAVQGAPSFFYVDKK